MASESLFRDIAPFPEDVPTASIPTISLGQLLEGNDQAEKEVLTACKEVGFFLLDLRWDETGKILMHEIDQLFSVCYETMNLPSSVKAQYQNDIPKSFLG
ncbi:hypothetical protein F5Y16DRAFT_154994 [Xylariaceae sp. FL0255]|nr:hypothetical protein F5Y16DRAFT_154994 [Xylariaceae sp. FL0255]